MVYHIEDAEKVGGGGGEKDHELKGPEEGGTCIPIAIFI
jgi:hypothetical protein